MEIRSRGLVVSMLKFTASRGLNGFQDFRDLECRLCLPSGSSAEAHVSPRPQVFVAAALAGLRP